MYKMGRPPKAILQALIPNSNCKFRTIQDESERESYANTYNYAIKPIFDPRVVLINDTRLTLFDFQGLIPIQSRSFILIDVFEKCFGPKEVWSSAMTHGFVNFQFGKKVDTFLLLGVPNSDTNDILSEQKTPLASEFAKLLEWMDIDKYGYVIGKSLKRTALVKKLVELDNTDEVKDIKLFYTGSDDSNIILYAAVLLRQYINNEWTEYEWCPCDIADLTQAPFCELLLDVLGKRPISLPMYMFSPSFEFTGKGLDGARQKIYNSLIPEETKVLMPETESSLSGAVSLADFKVFIPDFGIKPPVKKAKTSPWDSSIGMTGQGESKLAKFKKNILGRVLPSGQLHYMPLSKNEPSAN